MNVGYNGADVVVAMLRLVAVDDKHMLMAIAGADTVVDNVRLM